MHPIYEYFVNGKRSETPENPLKDLEDPLEVFHAPWMYFKDSTLKDKQSSGSEGVSNSVRSVSFSDKKDFCNYMNSLYEDAGVTSKELREALIAQDAVESNWGQSNLSKKTNNFGSIHAFPGWKGATYSGNDKDAEGKSYKTSFLSFATPADYVSYKKRWMWGSRYQIDNNYSPEEFFQRLVDLGYAESRSYQQACQNSLKTVKRLL